MHDCVVWVVEVVFGLGMFFNAVLFIPQAVRICRTKDARGLSLATFAGFNVIQFFTILHGYIHKDYILMFGFILSLALSGVVTFLIVFYRRKDNDCDDKSEKYR